MTGAGETLPSPSDRPGPFRDLRVVEVGDGRTSYAGLLLAGLGADVVRVEPPSGCEERHLGPFLGDDENPERSLRFWAYNRGKRSVELDLSGDVGRRELRRLVSRADVLLESVPLDVLEGLDLPLDGTDGLIHARLTDFGDFGPWAHYRSSDLVALALGGVAMNCGYDADPFGNYDLPPVVPQAFHSRHIAGEQLVIGIVAALLWRARTGRGQTVDLAIHQAVSANTELDVMNWVMLRRHLGRQTCRHASPLETNPSIVHTKDGRWMLAITVGAKDRRRLVAFLDRFGYADGLELPDVEMEGVRAVAGSTASATAGTEHVQRLVRRFRYDDLPWREAQEAGLLWTPLRRPEENLRDAHWRTRGTFREIRHEDAEVALSYPVSKWLSTASSWGVTSAAPRLGEHGNAALWQQKRRRVAGSSGAEADEPGWARSVLGHPFPLQGVRILDFSWFLASAGATRFLAALGADVLKVEWRTHPDTGRGSLVPEGGEEARRSATGQLQEEKNPRIGGQFNNKNPGKRGLSLNLGDPRGLAIAQRLLQKCDVVAEGFSPGVLERWGLGYEEQRRLRKDIIYVKQSGMGGFGEYGRFRATGPIAAGLSGISEMSGFPSPAPPAGWGYSYLDWFGAYSMALAILCALFEREMTGLGQWIDASQAEAGIYLTALACLDASGNGRPWSRTGNRSVGQADAPEGIYRCKGRDRWLAISCVGDEAWSSLCDVMEMARLTEDPRFSSSKARLEHRDELDALVESWTRDSDVYVAMRQLQSAGVAAGVCQTAEDRCDRDPQLRHLRWLRELEGSEIGRWPLVDVAFKLSETPAFLGGMSNRAAPLYGEDNHAILGKLLGMPEDEIVLLEREGVL